MFRRRALWLMALLSLQGCEPQIVLGDSESALPAMGGAAGSAGVAGGAGAAGSAPSQPNDALPMPGELVWSADHEAGTIDDWLRGGTFYGGEYHWGDVSFDVVEAAGRGGGLGLAIRIDTAFQGEPSQGVRLFRRMEEGPAFYTAWFRLEEPHTVSDVGPEGLAGWWSIALFHARDETLALETDVSLWDVRVVDTPSGDMALQFFDLETMQGTTADASGTVAPGEWFELSVYLDYRPPDTTRLAVLRDGVVLFDMKDLVTTTLLPHVFWAVGNGANGLSPTESRLALDDATIRTAGAP
jgi:hypothetical protein